MIFIVDNYITVKDYTAQILSWCKCNLIIDNPDYYKKQQMGKWTGNTPKEIWLFEKDGDSLKLPFGMLNQLWNMYPDKSMWKPQIKPLKRLFYDSSINLYPYQEKAVCEALRKKNGILVMPTGSGKTQTALEIISRIGGKALWLTHTQDLLNQSKARAESVLGQGGYGTITAGKVNIGTHITFATVQTMAKLNLTEYRDCFDVIITDEVQHVAGSPTRVTQFYKVLSSLSARYKIGLTATPKRADGLEKSMFALLGDIIHKVSRDEVRDTTCKVVVQTVETGYFPNTDVVLMGDGTLNYAKLVDDMVHDENRFQFVLECLQNIDSVTLVLGNRVEYLKRLSKAVSADKKSLCLSGMGNSKKAKEERRRTLEKLNNGELDIVFATYALAKEGLDVPNLRYVVFSTPEKDSTTVIQSVGRVGRKAPGKEYGTVIDFVDNFGMYKGWYKKRCAWYKRIDAEIN